ncbi:hypothetical protein [Zoogloea sp. LCSB751]|uniref:hypothetical protein n=1 Tax=Zoogloea sp. LCSB751 TaxID=1965277 RepID=UPI0013747A76|nr:hypothetical protein [Zoogloea sp. LCSB751]
MQNDRNARANHVATHGQGIVLTREHQDGGGQGMFRVSRQGHGCIHVNLQSGLLPGWLATCPKAGGWLAEMWRIGAIGALQTTHDQAVENANANDLHYMDVFFERQRLAYAAFGAPSSMSGISPMVPAPAVA